MASKEERRGYLSPEEQLLISSKVNRLCEAKPDTFDPITQVPDAQDIVNALDSRIRTSGRIGASVSLTDTGTSEVRAGATGAGSVNASFEEQETAKFEFGVEEYRVGNYVATKTRRRKTSTIEFRHFWDRGIANDAFEKSPRHIAIEYQNESLGVTEISVGIPTGLRFGVLILVNYKYTPLWKIGATKSRLTR